MLGTDEADERIEIIETFRQNLGEADIPILGYQWNPRGLVPMRTGIDREIRGGARAIVFDLDAIKNPHETAESVEREYPEAEFWTNYEYFVGRVVPVAEKAGVRRRYTRSIHRASSNSAAFSDYSGTWWPSSARCLSSRATITD